MRVAVTSVVRHARAGAQSGFLRVLDLEERRVLATYLVPDSAYRVRDPNPRGGVRGVRGIAVHDGHLVVANSDRLFILNTAWELERELTHRWMAGIHAILADGDGIWVTCTSCDLLLRLGWEGEVLDRWSWRDDPGLRRALGHARAPRFDAHVDHRDPTTWMTGVHNLVHLNAVAASPEGLALSFGRILPPRVARKKRKRAAVAAGFGLVGLTGPILRLVRRRGARPVPSGTRVPVSGIPGSSFAIVRLPLAAGTIAGPARVLLRREGLAVPNHDVLEHGDLLLYDDSNVGALVVHDMARGAVRRRVPIPGDPPFPRGLVELDAGRVLVGSQAPAAVHVVDLDTGRVAATMPLAGMPNETVHGIAVLPAELADPPPQVGGWSSSGAGTRVFEGLPG